MAKLAACVSTMCVLVLLMVLSESSPILDCCKNYREKPLAFKHLQNYTRQDPDYCDIKATIFLTKRKLTFCANPEDTWVIKAMKYLDKRNSKH
ncbi:C-C motif chemokine 20 [Cololabis saira]|uniref:C-C motif chemokine 20 n=1 Tax=Cololabis saira TaxID=129043 RepID=UPI002AD2357E|nr:C-C motif chemokine 20 [Cololabis saira]